MDGDDFALALFLFTMAISCTFFIVDMIFDYEMTRGIAYRWHEWHTRTERAAASRQAEHDAIRARADDQHWWITNGFLIGDLECVAVGFYGEYKPDPMFMITGNVNPDKQTTWLAIADACHEGKEPEPWTGEGCQPCDHTGWFEKSRKW